MSLYARWRTISLSRTSLLCAATHCTRRVYSAKSDFLYLDLGRNIARRFSSTHLENSSIKKVAFDRKKKVIPSSPDKKYLRQQT